MTDIRKLKEKFETNRWRPVSSALVILIVILPLFFVQSCETAIKVGRMPDLSVIEEGLIEPNISTEEDILKVLGVPRGKGRYLFTMEKGPQDLWYYYYEVGTSSDDQRMFLFIFFDHERYDGYMWFSSIPGVETMSLIQRVK